MLTTQTATNQILLPGVAMMPLRPFILGEWEPAAALVTTASILPEQWIAPQSNLGPEAALMRAVLEDALACFQKGSFSKSRRVQRLAREAEDWFFSDDQRWPFSG